ncbi:unnamed protein product [Penicillium bialowiezense]
MHFYTSIPALLSLVLSVTALPCDQTILTDSPDTNTTKTSEHVFINLTANGGLYLCENAGFRGYCVHYTEPYGRCSKQPHGYHIVDIPAKNKDKLPSQISSHLEIGEFPPQVLTAAVGVPSTRKEIATDKSFRSITQDMKIFPRSVGMIKFRVSTAPQNEAPRRTLSIVSARGFFSKQRPQVPQSKLSKEIRFSYFVKLFGEKFKTLNIGVIRMLLIVYLTS